MHVVFRDNSGKRCTIEKHKSPAKTMGLDIYELGVYMKIEFSKNMLGPPSNFTLLYTMKILL